MNVQEIMAIIPKLSFEEQLDLIETLSQSLRGVQSRTARRSVPAEKLRGVIKFPDGQIPDDTEIDELRFEALKEKYRQ